MKTIINEITEVLAEGIRLNTVPGKRGKVSKDSPENRIQLEAELQRIAHKYGIILGTVRFVRFDGAIEATAPIKSPGFGKKPEMALQSDDTEDELWVYLYSDKEITAQVSSSKFGRPTIAAAKAVAAEAIPWPKFT